MCAHKKGWKLSLHCENIIGDEKKKVNIRKADSHHVLPQFKLDELCTTKFNMKSHFDKEGFKTLNHSRFFEELKDLIMDAFECATKATSSTITKV